MFKKLIIAFVGLLLLVVVGEVGAADLQQSASKVAKLDNEKPKWGDTITVSYDPSVKGAKLARSNEVYTLVHWEFPDRIGYGTEVGIKMSKEQDIYKAKIRVPERACTARFVFFSMDDEDPSAEFGTMLYKPTGEPARGAHADAFLRSSFDPEKELALYPDNYSVYPEKWEYAKGDRQALVRADIGNLQNVVKGEPSEFLYALALGHVRLKDEPAAREAVRKLIQRYPESPLISIAMSRYENLLFTEKIEGDGPEQIRKLFGDLVRQHPETESGRMVLRRGSDDELFRVAPTEALETATQRWMTEQPDNPQPYFFLAAAYNAREQKLSEASVLIAKAINLFLQDRLRIYSASFGRPSYMWLPDAYRVAAQISLKQHDYAAAFSSVRTLESFQSASAETALLEAQIWEGLANKRQAERAYLTAWRRGSPDAEKKLESIYLAKYGNLDGFRTYLVTESNKTAAAEIASSFPPTFKAKALDSTELDLAALRGKVVVLNFWFIGCAYCEVERSGLNQLVKAYKDKDVVFISIALDKPEALRSFLVKKPFDYLIVAEGEKLAAKYEIISYPTHVIIDRNGLIALRSNGADATIWQDLRVVVDRLLQ